MSAKRLRTPGRGFGQTRRDFLRYGGGVVGASLLAPYWPARAMAAITRTIPAGPPSGAFDYYISTTGADSNAGTLASPWALTSLLNPQCSGSNATIRANQAKMEGKAIGLVAGTYNLMASYNVGSVNADWLESVLIIPSGTSSSLTYLGSCNTSGQYQALAAVINFGLTDANNPTDSNGPAPGIGSSNALNTAWTILDGIELTNTNNDIVSLGTNGNVPGPNHVRNCYIHGVTSTTGGANPVGIQALGMSGCIIENNYITNIVNSGGRNTAIETWGCINTVIQYNTIIMSNAGAGAIYIKNQIPQGQYNVAIQYNHIDLSAAPSFGGSGAVAWDLPTSSAHTSYLRNNIILANFPFQQGIAGTNNAGGSENKVIANNTIVSGSTFNPGGIHVEGSGPCVTHYNNIYSAPGADRGFGFFCCNADNPALVDYNLYPSNLSLGLAGAGGTGWPSSFASTLAAWTSMIGASAPNCIGKDAHAVLGTPTFAGGTPTLPGQAYQLSSGSAGKGAGSSNGQTSGTATDMGAWGGTDVNTGLAIAQIGCGFAPGSSTTNPVVPNPPILSVS